MKMEENVLQVSIDDIIPNRFQPRLSFDEQGLKELAASIKEHGIIQPLVLRKLGSKYEIIAGERRFKAAQMAGLTKVPAVISNIDDNSSAEIALVENIQRRDLTPIEEARSYKNLLDKGYTQDALAKKMGISQSSVANKLRLLNLDEEVQQALLEGKISERHARSLLVLNDPTKEKEWLKRIINERLTVRQLDQELKKEKESSNGGEIPLVDLSINIDNIKNNATDINKGVSFDKKDDVLNDLSSSGSTKIIDDLMAPMPPQEETLDTKKSNDIIYDTLEPINNDNTSFDTLDPLPTPDPLKEEPTTKENFDTLDPLVEVVKPSNNRFFNENFASIEEPISQTPIKKELEVLSSPIFEDVPPISEEQKTINENPVDSLNPNNKFFTPQNTVEEMLQEPIGKPKEDAFDPMSLLADLTTPQDNLQNMNTISNNMIENSLMSNSNITTAENSIKDTITSLQSLGYNVTYNENKNNGKYQITINID